MSLAAGQTFTIRPGADLQFPITAPTFVPDWRGPLDAFKSLTLDASTLASWSAQPPAWGRPAPAEHPTDRRSVLRTASRAGRGDLGPDGQDFCLRCGGSQRRRAGTEPILLRSARVRHGGSSISLDDIVSRATCRPGCNSNSTGPAIRVCNDSLTNHLGASGERPIRPGGVARYQRRRLTEYDGRCGRRFHFATCRWRKAPSRSARRRISRDRVVTRTITLDTQRPTGQLVDPGPTQPSADWRLRRSAMDGLGCGVVRRWVWAILRSAASP
jgi:hypothetical protein